MRPLLERSGKPDVVVVDPPRAGLSQKVVRRVLEAEAERVVYVSCNPTTLAPNARQMADAGYVLETVRPVDMFPQTPHIECVALLRAPRRPSRLVVALVHRHLLARVHRAEEAPVGVERRLISCVGELRPALRAGALDHRVEAVLLEVHRASPPRLRLARHDVLDRQAGGGLAPCAAGPRAATSRS